MTELVKRYNDLIAAPAKASFLKIKFINKKDNAQVDITSKVVNLILEQAIIERSSDIHIERIKDSLRVRYRIDGKLYEELFINNVGSLSIIARLKVLSNLKTDVAAKKTSQDGRFKIEFVEKVYDFRIATFPTVEGERVTIRILDKDVGNMALDRIGMNTTDQKRLERLLNNKHGLVLVTGPTGSGKTSTLYSMLNKLNNSDSNIITLEDPVEYTIPGMNQCDVKTRSNFGFADGLKAVLRQDPDIIMVGEIRDAETADIAIRASITGHLVFSSIHANSAIGTIIRLINMGLDPYMVSYSVIGVIAQRLVRQICLKCRHQVQLSSDLQKKLRNVYGLDPNVFCLQSHPTENVDLDYVKPKDGVEVKDENIAVFVGNGCENCKNSGYQGRLGLFEVVACDSQLRDAILNKASTEELTEIAVKNGTTLLAMDAVQKVKAGVTTIDEVLPILMER